MILEKYTKQPRERKDYDIDYAPFLGADTIDDVAVTVECLTDPLDSSLVCIDSQQTVSRAKLWMVGGTVGQRYKATVLMTTVGGRIDESELTFTIKDF